MTKDAKPWNWHEFSDAKGIEGAYRAERPAAVADMKQDMAGPEGAASELAPGLKNPDEEFQSPAPMDKRARTGIDQGPNGVGNSKGDGSIDPQGQQGGTGGGQPGSHPSAAGQHVPGTPLESDEERRRHSMPQRGSGFGRDIR